MKYTKLDVNNMPTELTSKIFNKTDGQAKKEKYIKLCRLTFDMSPELASEEYLIQSEFESDERYSKRSKFVNVGYFIKKNMSTITSAILNKPIEVETDDDKIREIALKPNNQNSLMLLAKSIINDLMVSDIAYIFTSAYGKNPSNAVEQSSSTYRGVTGTIPCESILEHLTIRDESGAVQQMCLQSSHYEDDPANPLTMKKISQYTFYIRAGDASYEVTYREESSGVYNLIADMPKSIQVFPISYVGEGGIPIIYDLAIAQINWMRRNSGNFSYVDNLSNPMGIGHGLNQALISTIAQSGECSQYEEGSPMWYRCAKEKFTGKSFIAESKDDIDFKYVELNGTNYAMQEENLKAIKDYIAEGFTRIVSTPRANKSAEESANESSEGINFYESLARDAEYLLNIATDNNLEIAGLNKDNCHVSVNKKFVEKPIDKTLIDVADKLESYGIINQRGVKYLLAKTGAIDSIPEDGFVDLEANI